MKRKMLVSVVLTCLLFLGSLCISAALFEDAGMTAYAASNIMPTASDNLQVGLRSTSELVATSNGYMRVFYNGKKINIEYYDNSFNIQSKKSVAMELDIWGGFYAGSNAYYVVEGKNNTAESDTAEVIRVIKYDTNWNKKGTAKITGNSLFGGDVRYPFNHGCVEMTEYNGTLYIVTGHEGYVDPAYGQGHQGFLMIAVDTASMKGEIVDCDLWHSFAQYIAGKDSYLYVLEQSEGSRYTKLSKYNAKNISQYESIPVLKYGGSHTSAWAISCYASVDGMAVSSGNVLCLGTSIDQSKYDTITSDDAHNIYLTVTPISNFTESATTVKWLTNYKGGGKSFLGTKITKVNDNRFMVSWEEFETEKAASASDSLSGSTLHYVFVDGKGNKLTKEFTAAAPISDCQPIVKGSKIVYYASNGNMVNFYTIDSETGSLSKKVYRVAGENATWEIKNGVLTISGTGAISVDTEANYRYPISSTRGWYSYSSSDNCWKGIRDNVEKIVISKGITGIPDNAFEYFDKLTEVDIQSGLKSIGKKAFHGNQALRKITIPASVTSIGEDILWTGSLWMYDESHVVYATIYGYNGSAAEKYAKKEGIQFVSIDQLSTPKLSSVSNVVAGVKVSWGKVSGAEKYRVFYKTGSGSWTKAGDTTSTSFTWTGAKNNTKYTFTVRCIDKDGKNYTSAYDTTGKSITFMSAPTVSVSNVVAGVKVSWGKVSGAANYAIFRKTPDGSYKKIGTATGTSYTDKTAKNNTKYIYAVRCASKDGKTYTSSYNAGKSITFMSAPTVSVSNVVAGVKVSWGKVTGAVNYKVYRKTPNGSYKALGTTTSTSFVDKTAKNNTKYVYAVRCVTKDGKTTTSSYNAGKSKTFMSAPTFSVSNVVAGVKISWNKVSGASNYAVFRKTSNGSYKKIGTTTGTSFVDKTAKSGTKYIYTVRCASKDGKTYTSSYNAGKSKTFVSAPTFTVSKTSTGVQIKWSKVTGASNYKVYRKTANGSYKAVGTTTGTSFVDKTAKKGTKYIYTVRCVSKDGKTATSSYNAGKSITR